jgi:hypothetical protein
LGSLFYGANRLAIEIDDAVLQALEMVTITKIRRREPFLFHWHDSSQSESGRGSVVIGPHSELHFSYCGSDAPAVDRKLVESMVRASNSSAGVRIDLAETAAPATVGSKGA